jgi:ATP-dependent protease ClpP protease subunit
MQYKNYGKNPIKSVLDLGGKRKTRADEEDGEFDDPRYGLYVKRLSVMDVDFHLNTSIQAPHLYNDLFQVLINADKDDSVRIWVDSGGGRIDTTLRILAALRDTDAEVTIIGCGLAASAASMLFLRSDNVVVTPEMTMMIHSASYGTGGKQAEIADTVHFNTKQLNKLLDETYDGFLTPLEIEHLKIGKEYHFDADEIIQRLEAREVLWQEQQIKREEAEKAVQKTPKPKPKTKAKVK